MGREIEPRVRENRYELYATIIRVLSCANDFCCRPWSQVTQLLEEAAGREALHSIGIGEHGSCYLCRRMHRTHGAAWMD